MASWLLIFPWAERVGTSVKNLPANFGIKSGTRNPQIVWPFVDESDVLCVPSALFVQIDPTPSTPSPWSKTSSQPLMAFRIWHTSARSAQYKTGSYLLPVARILIESAALQLVVEILLLALYSRAWRVSPWLSGHAMSLIYEQGITFNAITIPVKLRANSTAFSRSDPVQTIGCMPMKHIKVDITTQMEDDTDPKQSFPESSVAHSSA
ncbi:hypothetical protein PC9H_011608 [Pleurotus ostreatus]|uniref:Uncharacterized protein n=1 Tax=Pleurotus ostreatus TaxID=5322 RepID=A0A8H6ZM48_PLEOS|nr:uncharacterized protein PC9H_011608 [Pleurotus ostreatus]KAF7421088.1 hypothetical protein PC9H_011608 [Pleurotus ostreatus]